MRWRDKQVVIYDWSSQFTLCVPILNELTINSFKCDQEKMASIDILCICVDIIISILCMPSQAGSGVIFIKNLQHDEWKHFPRYWPFVWGIHRSPVNFHHKGQLRGALMFYLICTWIDDWVNNHEAGDLRRHRPHYDVIVMIKHFIARANAILLYITDVYNDWPFTIQIKVMIPAPW